jgi:hypothetical protein
MFAYLKVAIELALHLATMSGLGHFLLLLHEGQLLQATINTLVITAGILLFAAVFYLAKKLLDK